MKFWGDKEESKSPTYDVEEKIAFLTAEVDSLRREVDSHVKRLDMSSGRLEKIVGLAKSVLAELNKKIDLARKLH